MTLSTLDIKYMKKQIITYLIASIACIIFSIIYETFSHGVYSLFMICSFAIPLILGSFISLILYKRKTSYGRVEINLYNAGVATLTFGSIFQGVLEIYGTTNIKVYAYLFVGILLILISMAVSLIKND